MAYEPANDVPSASAEEPVSRARPKPAPVPHAPPPSSRVERRHPDEEAMLLMMKIAERVEVAKSFAKIATGMLTVTALQASAKLREVADAKLNEAVEKEGGLRDRYGNAMRIARAAAEAAAAVAAQRASAEPRREAPPPAESDVDVVTSARRT